ncbi:hypothetical protein RQP46_006202 [Phenoliferia psychrophenolica]
MTSTASIHWLAPQLLSRIFEHAHDPKLPSTMTSAALVCRAWRQPAQRLLLATKSMVRFLPPEILAHIFNLAHDPYTPSTMCSAALVCQDWRDPAQRALFQDVVMPDPNLKDLESLTFKPNVISKQPSSRPSPVWPSNLRKLCGEPVHVKFLLESHIAGLRPFVSGLTDCTISLPAAGHACPDLRPLFDILPVLSHFIIILKGFSDTSLNPQFLRSVVGTLPASIKRLTIERVDSGGWLGLDDALLSIPFKEIASLISNPVNLARLELPDVRRAELEGHAAAADVLAEYELKSIRVVCWEDLL